MEKTEKVRTEDISIGDWFQARMVKIDYEDLDITPPMRVAEISSDEAMLQLGSVKHYAFVEDLQPIPITAEVLEKNGFKKNGEYDEWNIGTWRTPYLLGVSLERPAITIKWNSSSVFIDQAKYIHQLQHALRLARVDKEIKM